MMVSCFKYEEKVAPKVKASLFVWQNNVNKRVVICGFGNALGQFGPNIVV